MSVPTLKTDPAFAQLATLFFLVFGIAALIFPFKVQAVALKKCKTFWGLPNPLLPFMETAAYIWMLRTMGVAALAAACLLEWVLIAGRR